MVKNESKT